MSTFSIFEIGRSALMTAKRTMDVTSHNVANASTVGYSRQEAVLEPIIQRQATISGAGVRVADVRRLRDRFVDSVLRSESGKKAAFEVEKEVMEYLQVVASEPSDSSIRSSLDLFWSAWHDLSVDASSASARAQVMERGRSLVDMFKQISGKVEAMSLDLEASIDATVRLLNLLSERIVSLNLEISRAIARQEPACDLMDQRDALLDEICELTGATVTHIPDGDSLIVSVYGFALVDRNHWYKMEVSFGLGGTELRWISAPGEYTVMPSVGGKIGGYKEARDVLVQDFKAELENLFKTVVDEINAIHGSGFPITGAPGDFFVTDGSDYLHSAQVAPWIVADPSTICASGVSGDPLDGSVALAIANRLEGDDASAGPTYNDMWTAIIGRLGAIGQKVESGFGVQEILVKELQNRKDSISGVSIDEEVATLVRQQHAFNAASRVITMADEMIDTIISRMGVAGR